MVNGSGEACGVDDEVAPGYVEDVDIWRHVVAVRVETLRKVRRHGPGAGTMAPSSSVTARGPRAARVLAWVSLAVGLASLTMSVTQTIARSGSLGAGWLWKPPVASAR